MPTKTPLWAWRLLPLALVVLLALTTILPAAPARAEVRSLFGRSPTFAQLQSLPVFTPDSSAVLFISDFEQDLRFNLYRAPLAGGEPVRLSAPPLGTGVTRFALSPDGRHVVYTSIQEVENRAELYSVPLAGGPPVKLSGPLPTGGNVVQFQIDPDGGDFVVYLADQQTNDLLELYAVPITGGTPVRLNAPFPPRAAIFDFAISANGQFVVYRVRFSLEVTSLISVPSGGGTPVLLNRAAPLGAVVDSFSLSPALNLAVYSSNESGAFELYSVQLNGDRRVKLNHPISADGRVVRYRLSPDGQRVVYEHQPGGGAGSVLYAVSSFGGTPVRLSPVPGPGGFALLDQISPDSSTAVFRTRPASDGRTTLMRVALAGGGTVTLFTFEVGEQVERSTISSDSQWVVFSHFKSNSEALVVAVPLGGGTPIELSDRRQEDAFLHDLRPQSDRVLFSGHSRGESGCVAFNLFSVQIFGGGRRRLTDFCDPNTLLVANPRWSPDGSTILFAVGLPAPDGGLPSFELLVSDGEALAPAPSQQRVYLPLTRR